MNRTFAVFALASSLSLSSACIESGTATDDAADTAAPADTVTAVDTSTAVDVLPDTTPSTCDEARPGETCVGDVTCYQTGTCGCTGDTIQSGCACRNGHWECVIDDSCYFACSDFDTLGGDTTEDADVADVVDATDVGDVASACPSEPPFGETCDQDGLSCDYGQECCCGECYPSTRCTCSGGGWACMATDACFIPQCPGCDDARDALAATLYEKNLGFTVVVRLDHETRAVLGYAVLAGAYASATEEAARATAEAETGYGEGATLLSGPDPSDDWVFYESPGDFGGVGVVSAHTGVAVFGGAIVWDGAGDITFPASWSPASDLASGCAASDGFGTTRGFDLVSEASLSAEDVDLALAAVADTALVAAIWHGGYAFDAVVLRYPRTVGAFDPTSAEWIVILNGGYLE